MPEEVVKKNYLYRAAGRTWRITELRLTRLRNGDLAVSQPEIDRVNGIIYEKLQAEAEEDGREFNELEQEFVNDYEYDHA